MYTILANINWFILNALYFCKKIEEGAQIIFIISFSF